MQLLFLRIAILISNKCFYEVKIAIKHIERIINDLKRHFENVNNCLLVQGCKPKVALLARLRVHRLRYINLTERIVARLHEGITE